MNYPSPPPVKPTPPEDWECCQSECGDFCVYEIYAKEKQIYDDWLKQQSTINAQID